MQLPHNTYTLTDAITKLREHGYDNDFVMGKDGLLNRSSEKSYSPQDIIIKKVYRFEGNSDPGDMSVVYAMLASDGTKGIYVDAFGTYSDHDPLTVTEFFKNVKIEDEHGDHMTT